MRCVLGLDVSTTATKAVLLDEAGEVVGVESSPHQLSTPRPLWSEQEPAEWWEAACGAIRKVLSSAGVESSDIAGVGLAGQMHGLVLLDDKGEIIRPAILWNDQRAAAQCDEIRNRIGLEELVRRTGNDAFAGFSLPKLLWVREHEPDAYGRVRQVLLPKDYVRYRLTGDYATDRAGAGGTLMLDLAARDWSREILDAVGVPIEWLPQVHEGTEITGQVSRAGAEATGLREGTPVVGGGGDQAAQAVGVGAVTPDVFALTVGTSGVVFAPCDRPVTDPLGRAHAFPHAVPDRWHVMGVMLSAAGSLQWFHDTLAPDSSFDTLVQEAEGAPVGSDGLTFLPYLSGERTPHADPLARGVFFGLVLSHRRGHLTRAIMEGVAFGLKDNLTLLSEAGLPEPREIRASGGALKSALWRTILADVLNVELAIVDATEGAAAGAALLAGVGTGIWPDITTACGASVRIRDVVQPEPAHATVYAREYSRFRELYPAVKAYFPDA